MVVWTEFAAEGLTVRITAGEAGIRRMEFNPSAAPVGNYEPGHWLMAEATRQIQEYLQGRRKQFKAPLDLRGTEFQRRVWQALGTIPYGETRSYRWLASAVGCPRGYQAVGQANGANPICIIVPCHRVIASDGSLGGYAGGLDVKRRLLQLEAMHAGPLMQAAAG